MKFHDWSIRHVKLRHRLFFLAFLVFVISRVRIPLLDTVFLGTASGTVITRGELAFILFVMFLYVLVELSVRTSAEARNISAYSAKLQRILHRIEEIRNKTALLFRSFEGALLSKRLHTWNDALKTASLSASDRKLIETIGMKIDQLQASVPRFRTSLEDSGTEGGIGEQSTEFGREKHSWSSEAKEIHDLLDKIKEAGKTFEERRRGLDRAISESRDVLTDAASFFSDKAGRGAEDLNAKLAIAVANIKVIQQELRTGSKAHYLDRYVFSLYLPRIIGLILVLLSTDVIMHGAFRLAERASDIISTVFSS